MSDDLDETDKAWVASFIGKSIPEGSVVEGFISIITWMGPDGASHWRYYNQLDRPVTSLIGLLELAKHQMLTDNDVLNEEGDVA